MKKLLFLFLFLGVATAIIYGLQYEEIARVRGSEVQKNRENGLIKEILVINEEGDIIFDIEINELNQWMKNNWDLFNEEPTVGNREVKTENFSFFDESVLISPDGRKVFLSVNDYAVATTISFPIIVDLETEKIKMVKTPARGEIEETEWSGDSSFIAYSLNTARAGGDFLRVDNVFRMEKEFILEAEDIIDIMDPDRTFSDANHFMPEFRKLQWNNNKLKFASNHPGEPETMWVIDRDGGNLEKLN